MNTININGMSFEFHPRAKAPFTYKELRKYNGKDLTDYYQSFSRSKNAIWREWDYWALTTIGIEQFGVSSANTFSFCFCGLYNDGNGRELCLWVTPLHNRAYVMKG